MPSETLNALPSILPKVALGAAALGASAGVIGAFAVLRRRSLLGDTLAHAALPGICVAHLVFATRDLISLSVGALAAGLLGVLCVTVITRWTRTREDAALGLVLSTFFGAGIVLLTVIQRQATGNQAGLDSYLFGEIATLRDQDITLLWIVAAISIALVALLVKELKLLCFDESFAQAQGWPTFAIDLGIMSAVAVVTIIGLPVCGVVLMAAMLIFPCTIARYWSASLGWLLILSGIVGAAAAAGGVASVGLFTGAAGSPPPGPMIVLTSAGLFLVSLFLAPGRGLIAVAWQNLQTRLDVTTDHVLRLLFEMSEKRLPERAAISDDRLRRRLTADAVTRWITLWQVRRRGWIEPAGDELIRLTQRGLEAAARVTRIHRLWETFLVEHADIATDHVHRDADDLEHYLPAGLVAALERQLASAGRLPLADAKLKVPESPHEVSENGQ